MSEISNIHCTYLLLHANIAKAFNKRCLPSHVLPLRLSASVFNRTFAVTESISSPAFNAIV